MAKNKKKSKTATKKKTPKKSTKKPFLMIILAGFVALLLYKVVFKGEKQRPRPVLAIGPVDLCRKIPPLTKKHGMKEPLMIDLRQQAFEGLRIIEARENGKILQMEEWDDAGHLGPYTLDEEGNIYTAPVPYVSLEVNKQEDQNRIMKVDGKSGEMYEYIRFPYPTSFSHNNPYGVMGLTYDCQTKSIYASSLAGSDPDKEQGIIYQVNAKTKEIVSKLEGIDAIGINIFITKTGKRLYYGSAREPEVFSIALDEEGRFKGSPSFEFSLMAQKGGSADRAHRIRFSQNNGMEVKGIEFSYSLMAASDPLRNIYNFVYDRTKDDWISKGVHKQ